MDHTDQIRILHVVTYMGRGGLETMLMNYYRHIDRSKVQFDFLVHRAFRADYDDEIESLGGRIFRLPRLVPWSRRYLKELEQFFRNHPEYKVIHVHQDCLSSVILKAAKKCGVPVRIAHSHNSNQDKNLKYLIKLVYKKQIPSYATHLFSCGKDAGDWMFGGAPYQMMNNAIDTQQYRFDADLRLRIRKDLAIDAETFVVGHVGRFHPQKNHKFLIDIFSKVKALHDNAVLLLVGDGDLRTDVEKQIMVLGISDSVIFAGVRSDVPALMQAMDCFVFPSLYEGLSIATIEAQTSGLPCIFSDGVPTECVKTDFVKRLPLLAGATVWAEEILKTRFVSRQDTSGQIIKAGYDINTNAAWLQGFYLEQWKDA